MTPIALPASITHALCHPELDASAFSPTRFTPAVTKLWFARHTLLFLASDCPRHQYTERFHNQLVHCFGVASCYDRRGFWTEHFRTAHGKAVFVGQVARHPASGTPNPV